MANQNNGLFLPTTYEFDVSQIGDTQVNSPEFKELIIRLYQNINNIILALNVKETGYYVQTEFVTGKLWYPNPSKPTIYIPLLRKVVPLGPIFPGVNAPVTHGLAITNTWKLINIEAVANDNVGFNYYPLPWASAAGATNIQLYLDQTNIYVTNSTAITFTSCDVVIEYKKS